MDRKKNISADENEFQAYIMLAEEDRGGGCEQFRISVHLISSSWAMITKLHYDASNKTQHKNAILSSSLPCVS